MNTLQIFIKLKIWIMWCMKWVQPLSLIFEMFRKLIALRMDTVALDSSAVVYGAENILLVLWDWDNAAALVADEVEQVSQEAAQLYLTFPFLKSELQYVAFLSAIVEGSEPLFNQSHFR